MSLRTMPKLFSRANGDIFHLPRLARSPANFQWTWNAVAIVLLAAFLWQDGWNFQWSWLQQLQTKEWYRYLSGVVLMIYIAIQWLLTVVRVRGRTELAKVHYRRHQRVGALGPLFFYAHSSEMGYAYVAVLSSVFFLNLAVGLLNPTAVRVRSPQYKFWWVVGHVLLSVSTAVIAGYHAYVAFYYK
ncbi:MAG: hypothetical protein L0332_17540 [Chloroflexi bacterium]|nr:hypothetical protein [Chloroflexota bacterium]MCI0580337.1 hypothetical protein [Chloroflexota bacterium]MCI0648516.1 hypothetical protein [Chloroflexota bacterium]MCI0728504.1 hypothetical protein [Chloroflexota bacterium]